jgi:hypothetical protein
MGYYIAAAALELGMAFDPAAFAGNGWGTQEKVTASTTRATGSLASAEISPNSAQEGLTHGRI